MGYRTRMSWLCLVAWGLLLPLGFCILCKPVCICAPLTRSCLFLSSVSSSFCVWNLHNVVQPSRLIIHVLPWAASCQKSACSVLFLGSCSHRLVPEVFWCQRPLCSVTTWGTKLALAPRYFSLTPARLDSQTSDVSCESASSQTPVWVMTLFKVPGWPNFPVHQVLKRLSLWDQH